MLLNFREESFQEESISRQSSQRLRYRWIALISICIIPLGYKLSNIHSFATYLLDYGCFRKEQLHLLNMISYFPTIITSYILGIFIDFKGVRPCLFLAALTLLIGEVIQSQGFYNKTYVVQVVGSTLVLIGQESLEISTNCLVIKWFRGREISLVFGIMYSVQRVYQGMNFYGSANIYKIQNKIEHVFYFCIVSCLITLLTVIFLNIVDRTIDIKEGILKKSLSKFSFSNPLTFTMKIQETKLLLIPPFWYLVLFGVFLCTPFNLLLEVIADFNMQRYGTEQQKTNGIFTKLYIYLFAQIIILPFLGILVDRLGQRIKFLCLSLLLFTIAYIFLLFNFIQPDIASYIFNTIIVLSISVFETTFWPSIILTTEKAQLGTAFGIINSLFSLSNTLLSLFQLLYYRTNEHIQIIHYLTIVVISLIIFFIAFVFLLLLWIYESKNQQKLLKSILYNEE